MKEVTISVKELRNAAKPLKVGERVHIMATRTIRADDILYIQCNGEKNRFIEVLCKESNMESFTKISTLNFDKNSQWFWHAINLNNIFKYKIVIDDEVVIIITGL